MLTLSTTSLGLGDARNLGSTKAGEPVLCSQQEDFNFPIRTVNDLLLSKIAQSPDAVFVSYPATPKGRRDYTDYTVSQIEQFANNDTHKYAEQGLLPEDPTASCAEIVAILAPSNLDYAVSIFALSRMGFAILFLSTRLSTEGYIDLLEQTACKKMVVSSRYTETAQEIQASYPISIYDLPTAEDYATEFSRPACTPLAIPNIGDRVAFIIHSSGSIGLPKPIYQTNSACLSNYAGGIPHNALLTLPLFHNHGLSTFFRALSAGRRIALYNANLPLSGSTLTEAIEALKPGSLHCVPYALKLMAESERGVEALKSCKLVLFGGSSCPDDLGDQLVAAGVFLVGHYGATEMGQLMTSFREPGDSAWNYMRPLATAEPFLKMVPVGENIFELVVLDGLRSKVASNSDDPPNSFHTKDTFSPHPSLPNAWKYLGRIDDRVTLVNGEKVLPVPYEHHIRQHPLVKEAVVFGIGKDVPGLLIIPSDQAQDMAKEYLKETLLPTVQEANSKAEAFGRVFPEMIEILDSETQYPKTDKGTIIRAAFYREFADVISAIYDRFEAAQVAGPQAGKRLLTEQEAVKLIVDLFQRKLGIADLQSATDFFEAGVDSLQATTIRAQIMREVDLGGRSLGQNVVFEYPTAELLAKHICSDRVGSLDRINDEIGAMKDLIDKYSDFSPRISGTIQPPAETVLVTGATGSLGAHILAQLVKLAHVNRVWCLTRASSPLEAQIRVLGTLSAKGISGLTESHLKKISSVPSDLSRPDLGLSDQAICELKMTLTTVIHSAWAVNFNLGVRSFEAHHIQGTYNLLKFCQSTDTIQPAQLFFCSSISAAAGTPIPATVSETYIDNLAYAQNMGYARSKIVTEHIVKAAVQNGGMKAKVLRLGQIVGDTEHGMWNTTEAIPLMIESVKILKALPALDETPSWMPVNLMARACIELAGLEAGLPATGGDSSVVFQVQNHRLFHWTDDWLPALQRAGLDFRIVSQREWVRLLRESNPNPVENPAFKLLDFFANKYDNNNPGRAGLKFDMTNTKAASKTVESGFNIITSGIVDKIVLWWKTQW